MALLVSVRMGLSRTLDETELGADLATETTHRREQRATSAACRAAIDPTRDDLLLKDVLPLRGIGAGYAMIPLMTLPWTFVSRRRMPSW